METVMTELTLSDTTSVGEGKRHSKQRYFQRHEIMRIYFLLWYLYVCERLTLEVFLNCFPHYFLKQDLSLNLQLINSIRLVDYQVPKIYLYSPSPTPRAEIMGVHQHAWLFFLCGYQGSNSRKGINCNQVWAQKKETNTIPKAFQELIQIPILIQYTFNPQSYLLAQEYVF